MPQTFNVGSRSIFVSTVAWFFMAMAMAGMLGTLLRFGETGSLLDALPTNMAFGVNVSAYWHWVALAGLVLSGATLAAAAGLLLRLDWARRAFITLLVLAMAAAVAALWIQHELVRAVVDTALSRAALPAPVMDVFGGFVIASRVMGALVTFAACCLLGWTARRLMSPSVRQEFA